MTTCVITGCGGPIYQVDMCCSHYMRLWRYGSPFHHPVPVPRSPYQPRPRGVRSYLDLTGMRFGSLTAQSRVAGGVSRWTCICDCGNTSVVRTGDLNRGSTASCGGPAHPRRPRKINVPNSP